MQSKRREFILSPMYKRIRTSSRSPRKCLSGHPDTHRFEHWYVDNQVYFITARCRDRFPAFATSAACDVFWDRFEHYTQEAGCAPFVASLVFNHYHFVGYVREGMKLQRMMQRLHGSVAKLVNDLLPERRSEFWRDEKGKEYFDGCIRDEKQCRAAYRYTLTQCRRHGITDDYRLYPNTRVYVEIEAAVRRALQLEAFMEGMPYKRYERRG